MELGKLLGTLEFTSFGDENIQEDFLNDLFKGTSVSLEIVGVFNLQSRELEWETVFENWLLLDPSRVNIIEATQLDFGSLSYQSGIIWKGHTPEDIARLISNLENITDYMGRYPRMDHEDDYSFSYNLKEYGELLILDFWFDDSTR